jgi:hypothetical protein
VIKETLALLDDQRLPEQALPPLGLLPDQKADLAELYGEPAINAADNLLNNFRAYLSRAYGLWSLPNLTTARILTKSFRLHRVLEVMAGNGYWSQALQAAGCQLITTDSKEWSITSATGAKPVIPVKKCSAAAALTKWGGQVDAILCAWAPNFNQADWELLQLYRKLQLTAPLFFIGEQDGATNSPQFWTQAHLHHSLDLRRVNRSFASFDFIDEKFFLVS